MSTTTPEAGLPVTRPNTATRKARRRGTDDRKVIRFTLDLSAEQHRYLRMFAVSNNVEASRVCRALLWLLEAGNELPPGHTLADLVLDEVFSDETPGNDD